MAPALPPPIPVGSSKCSDLENARRIQKVYGKNIIAIGEAFYIWSGTHWVKDDAPVCLEATAPTAGLAAVSLMVLS